MSKFKKAVKRVGGRKNASALLGCSVEFVRLMEEGDKTPGLALALKIQEVMNVPVEFWARRRNPETEEAKAS